MILHSKLCGRYLVNTGTSLLGSIYWAVNECLMLSNVNTQPRMEPIKPGSNCIRRGFLITFMDNFQLHKPGHLCIVIVTVLKNRLLYQVYNTPCVSGVNQSWYLVYEEVVPADTQLTPAANISLGLSALKLRGLLYDR